MSDSTTKRVKVSKPEKKKPKRTPETTADAAVETLAAEEPLIDIPVVKKKKERRVKTEADIAAKQERKRLRKEAELAKKGPAAAAAAAAPKPTQQNKTPKWKQFLKNSSEADNAEQLKDTSYKVKGDDGSGDEDSDNDSDCDEDKAKASKKADKKRKSDKDMENGASKSKKSKQEDSSKLASLDTATPGLAYLVEWKRARATWKFQKLRQVWLINNMYDDTQLPSTHWGIFLDYIHDLKGAARTAAIQEAKKIVEAPEPEEDEKENEEDKEKDVAEEKSEDVEMKDENAESEESTIPLSEEEKAAEEAAKAAKVEAKRAAEVKAARALDVLRVLA